MFHLSDRELRLLGQPTRNETLALVGWMSVTNLFGDIGATGRFVPHGGIRQPTPTRVELSKYELPPALAAQWIGGLRGLSGTAREVTPESQQCLPNGLRRIRATAAINGGLSTGNN